MEALEKKLKIIQAQLDQIFKNINAAEAGKVDLQNKINQWYIDGAEFQGQIKLVEEMIAGLKNPVPEVTSPTPDTTNTQEKSKEEGE